MCEKYAYLKYAYKIHVSNIFGPNAKPLIRKVHLKVTYLEVVLYSTSVLLWSINSYLKAPEQTNQQTNKNSDHFWLCNFTFWTLETLDEDLTTMLLQCSHSKSSCYGNWGISNWQDKFCPHILCWPYIKHSGLFHE